MSTGAIRLAGAGLLCVVCIGLSGCFFVSDNSNEASHPTVGRELSDLKAARDCGAIEPEEYKEARHKVLARLDKPCK
jgi:hypothetical protein